MQERCSLSCSLRIASPVLSLLLPRDTRDLLKTTSMDDAYAFVDSNSHPRLWRILAEHALEQLDFSMADKAFVRCADYQGIQVGAKQREGRQGWDSRVASRPLLPLLCVTLCYLPNLCTRSL